jgi:hypothetical protein
MVTDGWELVGDAEERKRRLRKKKNEAFRQRLNEEKLDHKEHLYLKMAAAAAALAWAIAVLRAWS